MSVWTPAVGKLLKEELDRLKSGNKREQQRYENALETISTVVLDPWKDYGDLKSGIGDYRAANVLAQYRMFYELVHAEKVVHFVWLNDDTYIHTTSKNPDPCYERFKNLAAGNKIPKYTPKPKPTSPTISGFWKKSTQIYCSLSAGQQRANSTLFMQQQNSSTYQIQDINATEEGTGLELQLLDWVSKRASQEGVQLFHELDLKRDPETIKLLRGIFSKCGFNCTATSDIELWEK